MSKFFEVGGYKQKVWETGEISCSCKHGCIMTEMYPNDYQKRGKCKHIKLIEEFLKRLKENEK